MPPYSQIQNLINKRPAIDIKEQLSTQQLTCSEVWVYQNPIDSLSVWVMIAGHQILALLVQLNYHWHNFGSQ